MIGLWAKSGGHMIKYFSYVLFTTAGFCFIIFNMTLNLKTYKLMWQQAYCDSKASNYKLFYMDLPRMCHDILNILLILPSGLFFEQPQVEKYEWHKAFLS